MTVLARLGLRWEELDEVGFDSGDAVGARITSSAEAATVGFGTGGGVLSGAGVSAWLEDGCWHLSAAGRRAELVVPRERSDFPSSPDIGGTVGDAESAAWLFHRAMLEIRSVRYPHLAPRVPLRDFCRAFEGAGAELLSAARSRRFGSLVDGWAARGGPRLSRWFAATTGTAGTTGVRGSEPGAVTTPAVTTPRARPSQGELRFVSYAGATAELLYATPPTAPTPSADGPWQLRSWRGPAPARLLLRTEAFRRVP